MLQQHYYARGRYAPVLVRSSCTYQRFHPQTCRAEAELIAKMGVVDGSEALGKWLRACLPAPRSPFDAIPVAPTQHEIMYACRPQTPFYIVSQVQSCNMSPLGLFGFGLTTALLQVRSPHSPGCDTTMPTCMHRNPFASSRVESCRIALQCYVHPYCICARGFFPCGIYGLCQQESHDDANKRRCCSAGCGHHHHRAGHRKPDVLLRDRLRRHCTAAGWPVGGAPWQDLRCRRVLQLRCDFRLLAYHTICALSS